MAWALSIIVIIGVGLPFVAWLALVAEGAVLIASGIALVALSGNPAGIVPAPLGAWYLAKGAAALRSIRRGPGRAYQLNA